MSDKPTTIRIRPSIKNKLDQEGSKGETYEEIINRVLLELWEYRRRCG